MIFNYKFENKAGMKAYDEDYKEYKKKLRERQKKYRENNKEKIAERQKKYRENNKEKEKKRKQIYRENNKEKVNKTFNCECGSVCRVDKRNRHYETFKHIKFIEEQKRDEQKKEKQEGVVIKDAYRFRIYYVYEGLCNGRETKWITFSPWDYKISVSLGDKGIEYKDSNGHPILILEKEDPDDIERWNMIYNPNMDD